MYKEILLLALISVVATTPCTPALAQDITNLGGDLSTTNESLAMLQLPAANMTSHERSDFHFTGHSLFHQLLDLPGTARDKKKIGPLFNHTSCGGCHVNDGRGPLKFTNRAPGSAMLVKVSLKGLNRDGSARDVPGIGEQVQDHAVGGRSKYSVNLRWKFINGTYPDGTKYQLRKPVVSFRLPGIDTTRIVSSLRHTPSVIGMGLLEAVSESTLLQLADPKDSNNDGISGEVNYVVDKETKGKSVGRFGFKANHPTVRQQSAAAAFHDMGVTNPVFQDRSRKSELSEQELRALTFYVAASSVPVARNQTDPEVIAGKALFLQIGCEKCHTMTLRTGEIGEPELLNQEIHPFTDLLLHDMGPGLADKRSEYLARGSEWRTSPLWGIGLTDKLASGSVGYLHDGRARTLEEAILWHDGEAKRTRRNFQSLSASSRAQLITFLRSL